MQYKHDLEQANEYAREAIERMKREKRGDEKRPPEIRGQFS